MRYLHALQLPVTGMLIIKTREVPVVTGAILMEEVVVEMN
jgi:hypothetical protein